MTLSYPSTVDAGARLTISGHLLSSPPYSYSGDEVVHITRSDLANPTGVSVGSAALNADGTFTFTDTPHIGGTNWYQVSYAGSQSHAPSSATATVDVNRLVTTLSIDIDGDNYAYGAWAKITVHLGPTYDSRTVDIVATPSVGVNVVTRTGTMDAKGNLVEWFRMTADTDFTASFAGDSQYYPANIDTAASVHAGVYESQAGYYTSVHYGGTVYRVYHHTTRPLLAAGVAPNKAGECAVAFRLQEYYRGAWRPFTTSRAFCLDSSSVVAVWINARSSWIGHLFRIDAVYQGDQSNIATNGDWQYFTIRR
jgi:hypothetical protein